MAEASDVTIRLLQRAAWPGVLDILLVWFVIYQALVFIKGAHSHHLKGAGLILALLAILWMVTRPGYGLPFETFNWLVGQLAPFGLIALVVLFQPELRQSFGQLGQFAWLGRSVSAADRSNLIRVVNEVAEAAETLSQRKIGALIAFERRDPLTELLETGKDVRAEVSADLLVTLFYPSTPMHDGAVIVRQHRIEAVCCVLPLSERRDLASSLGTRHRAALGLTEKCDAAVVVISEETGLVSLAVGGELHRGLGEEELKGQLLEWLQPAGTGLLSGAPDDGAGR